MPTIADLFNQAIRHHQSGQPGLAENLCRQILQADPRHGHAWHFLGILAGQAGRLDLAVAYIGNAVRFIPDFAPAHSNLGNFLRDQGKLTEAQACYREAIRWQPDFAEAHFNLGNILCELGNLEEGQVCYHQALRFRPGYAEACNNLGNVLRDQGKLKEAETCYQEALRLKPGYAEAHLSLSFYQLLHGNFAEGWRENEWRRQTKDRHGIPAATWDGGALAGQAILLQAEQGVGDTFQFVRYARLVQEKGGRVLLQCPSALTGILARCPGIDQLVPQGAPLPHHKVAAPLLSLPLLLGTTLSTIPANVPYLTVDPARVERWRARSSAIPGCKVGICWQGNADFKGDCLRSVPLSYFAPLAKLPGVSLIALQRGPGLEQIAQQGEHLRVIDLPGRSEDPVEGWLDTAALIKALDLVISTDTGVVHLAGALGAQVWVALSFIPDWRWLLNREDSPWYPTMRLFRQPKPRDWPEVFQRITQELRGATVALG